MKTTSRTQRIRTGFRHIGVTIAVVIGVPSVGAMLMSLPIGMGWMPEDTKLQPSEWPLLLLVGAIFLGLALFGYLAAWALGWIITGFVGDDA